MFLSCLAFGLVVFPAIVIASFLSFWPNGRGITEAIELFYLDLFGASALGFVVALVVVLFPYLAFCLLRSVRWAIRNASILKTDVESIAESENPDERLGAKAQASGRFDKRDIEDAVVGFCGFSGLLGWWLARVYDEELFHLFFLFFLLFGFWIPVLVRLLKRNRELRVRVIEGHTQAER